LCHFELCCGTMERMCIAQHEMRQKGVEIN
jgi:hypothetical protein